MGHARIDERYDDRRKIRRAWKADPRSIGVHIMAITYCRRQKLDGKIPDDWLEDLLPRAADRSKVLKVMVDAELFDLEPHEYGRYAVHDYLDWNASAAQREAQSELARHAAETRYALTNGHAKRSA